MSKLTTDRIPSMTPKPKKLGLLTAKKRKNMTARFQNDTIARLEKLLIRCHESISFKISRTDIMEALIFHAQENLTNTDIKNILRDFGKG